MSLQNTNSQWETKIRARVSIFLTIILLSVGFTYGQMNDKGKVELIVQTAQTDEVFSVAFSPDGKILASGSQDNTIKLWDVVSGEELRSLQGNSSGVVFSVAFSPDGKTLASGSEDKTIKLWDVASGRELKTLKGHSYWIFSVAFSPDGKTVASGSNDNTIKLWNVASGKLLRTLQGHTSSVKSVVFSPDGRTLLSGSLNGIIKLWNSADGKLLRTLKKQTNSIYSVAFSPDGKTLASGGCSGTEENEDEENEDEECLKGEIKLWNAASGAELRTFPGHTSWVESVEFSPNGKILASGSSDKTVKLWNVTNGQELRTLQGHTSSVKSVAFSLNGRIFASGSSDKTVKIWNVANGQELRILQGQTDPVYSVAFSPTGRIFASGSCRESDAADIHRCIKGEIKLWNAGSGQELSILQGHTERVVSVVFSPDGKLLASGSWDDTIKLWDVASRQELHTLHDTSNSVVFSPDGKILASGSSDDTIKLWDVASGKELYTLQEHPGFVLAFSPDGKILASGTCRETKDDNDAVTVDECIKGEIKLWDVASGEELHTLQGHTSWIQSVSFSSDGKTFVSGSLDKTVKLWNVANGKLLRTLMGHTSSVESVAFSPDGKTLASGTYFNKIIKIWDVASGKLLKSFQADFAKTSAEVFSAVPDFFIKDDYEPISSDGRFQIKRSESGKLNLFEVKTGKPLASLITLGENDWAVVTPEGVFDGSPNAWKQLLWRFDNNTFDYAPVEAFFKEFYRPGLLQDIFAENKIETTAQDLSKIDIRQPFVKISAIDGKAVDSSALLPDTISAEKKTVRIKVEIADNNSRARSGVLADSSDAKDVRLFRNGSLVKFWKKDAFQLSGKDGCEQIAATKDSAKKVVCEADVQITSDKNELTAYAFNHDNVKSSDAVATVKGADVLKRQGTMYVLAVGVNEYANAAFNLKFAVRDVETMSKEFSLQQTKLSEKPYAETKVITLTDKQATKANFVAALKKFADGKESVPATTELEKIKQIQPEDALIIYFAGHGLAYKDRFYLIPHDGIPTTFAGSPTEQQRLLTQGKNTIDQNGLNQMFKQSISDLELEDLLENVNAGKLLMVIDACNSGQALEAEEKRRGPMNSKGLAQLAYEKGMNILTASQSFQAAIEASSLNHGLLTYALLEGLKKGDKNDDKTIIDREWLNYGVAAVPQLQIEARKNRQLVQKKETNSTEKETDLQTPRVFYRRENDVKPLVIALQ